MSAPAGQAARRLAPAGAAALAGLAAGDRTEALRDRPTESEEVPLAGSWLEIGLKPGDVDVDGGLEILAPAAVETIPVEAVASEAARRSVSFIDAVWGLSMAMLAVHSYALVDPGPAASVLALMVLALLQVLLLVLPQEMLVLRLQSRQEQSPLVAPHLHLF